ncbi:MAG: leucine-rich repeat domain-containing protein [Muribaculaceae bacterium]|nr:leucine-rich repeat domain-containing protein [Muribaculaceae bacterium]
MKYNLNKLLFAIVSLFLSTTALAHDFEVNGIYYNFIDQSANTVAVTFKGDKYYSYSDEYTSAVTIPSSVTYWGTTYSVTEISYYAFCYCSSLTSITIPNSVTSIGDEAFSNCTGLSSVTIPNSVTSIGVEAFFNCTSLTEVNISDLSAWCKISFRYTAANPLFNAKTLKLNGSEIKNLVIPDDISQIKSYAFPGCTGLTSVTIPNSVTSIGEFAFYDCTGLTSVTIPNSVTSIGSGAFHECTGLTEATIGNSVTSIGDEAFSECTGLTSVAIPNSVTEIGKEAFYDCSDLISVTIPNSVTSIGDKAFSGTGWYENQSNGILYLDNCCLGYKGEKPTETLTIKDGTHLISSSAFSNCYGLTEVTIPNSVTSIGDYAFTGCTSLTSVTIPNSVTSIGSDAFLRTRWYGNLANGVIYINNVLYKYKGTMPEGTSISIKDGTISISPFAFFTGCTGLTSVTIPNTVTSIGDKAFYRCTGLTEIIVNAINPPTIQKNSFANYNVPLTIIEGTIDTYKKSTWSAFKKFNEIPLAIDGIKYKVTSINELEVKSYDNNLSSELIIPSTINFGDRKYNVTSISSDAFYGCTSLTSVTIPNSVTEIGNYAFCDCDGLKSVTIGNSVVTIGNNAFYNCGLRLVVSYCMLPPTCADGAFDGNPNNSYSALLKVPEGTDIKYAVADEWYKFGKIQEIIGVEGVEADNNTVEEARYDMHGRLLSKPTKGINIIKMSDGSTRKEIIKE